MNIKEVTLYQTGVGFFNADCPEEQFTLPVNENDINDVLKSLSINGLQSVRFSSAEEYQKVLSKIGITLNTDNALLSICYLLIGLKVKVKTKEKEREGMIMGIDNIKINSQNESTNIEKEVLVLKINDEVHNFPLKDIQDIEILDDIVLKDLQTYLNFVANKRKAGIVNLNIVAQPNTWATWIMPVSSWRLSYRIFFKEKKKLDLYGIALVDNTTSIDWEKVVLRLVTGKPISFRYDLFNPLFIIRPQIERDVKGIAPIISEAGGAFADFDKEKAEEEAVLRDDFLGAMAEAAPPPMKARGRPEPKMAMAPMGMETSAAPKQQIMPTIEAMKEELGAAVAYKVNYPITIERSQSALIPIFQEKLDGELCVILRDDKLNEAMDAIKLKKAINLDKGAATIYLDGVYAGDAMIITGTEYIAFRLNREVSAMKEIDTKYHTESMNIAGVNIVETRSTEQIHTYKFINHSKEPLQLILEILKYGDYKPLEKPDAETPSYCRYKILLNPGNSVKKFTFKTFTDLYIQITSLSQTDVDAYFKNKLLTINDKKKVESILEANLDLHIKEEALKRISSEIDKNFKNQARIRENILIVRDDMKMREDYLNKFKEIESSIEKLKKELTETKMEIEKIKGKLMAIQ